MNDVEFLRHLAEYARKANYSDVDSARLREIADKLIELDERDTILCALEAGGVDNWEWFEASLEDAGL